MNWYKQFQVERDGDRYERLWWPILREEFSEWGRFWVHHIVPLTNRINHNIPATDPKKMYTREDFKMNQQIERMVMANYSVLYYLGRARAAVLTEPHLFPEDVFIFLRATTENLERFVGCVRGLLKSLGTDRARLPPAWQDIKDDPTIVTISEYRNAFVHSPRLGRHPSLDWEFVPKRQHLKDAQISWTYVQALASTDFEDARQYLLQVQKDLILIMNPLWKSACQLMDEQAPTERYRRSYGLNSLGEVTV
jgi:hypothetical protein